MTAALTRYRHLAIKGAQTAPSAEELSALESELGRRLPTSLRDFLEVGNGGYLEYVVDVDTGEGTTEPLSFCSFYATRDEGGSSTFLAEIRFARQNLELPVGVLPLAVDGGGSTLYLDLTDRGRGRVVGFVHGLPGWARRRTQSAYIELAASFDDYVAKLRIDREAALDHLEHDVAAPAHVDAIEESLDIGLPEWRADEELTGAVRAARRRLRDGQ